MLVFLQCQNTLMTELGSPPNRTISFVCFLQKSTKKLANYFLNGYTFTVIGKQAY